MKKIIALLLCTALCLCLAAGAFASGEEEPGETVTVVEMVREAIRKVLRESFGIDIWDDAGETPGEPSAEPAEEIAEDGGASGELPTEAMDVMEFGGEEYVRLDDLIIALILGRR